MWGRLGTGRMQPPAKLKHLAPYLARAHELDNRDPVVAYYCRYYAVQEAVKEHSKDKDHEVLAFLMALMDKMEADKKALAGNEAITQDIVGQAHVESFALKLFDYADQQDRAGKADKRIARTFYSSSYIMEVLKTFGELDAEVRCGVD